MTDPTVVWPNNENKQAFVLAGNYDTADIVCHVNNSPAPDFVEVAAGDFINLQWTDWPISHIGPIITYLANAGGDFSQVDTVNLQFVKIEELGLIRNSTDKSKPQGYYAANKLIDSGNKWMFQVPDYVAPGNYVVRHEIIALMGAIHLGHAQHYPQCINIKVTGNGKDPIASGVRAKDFYKATDPGIQVMIYKDIDYQIPGPKLYQPNGAVPPVESTTPVVTPSPQRTSVAPVVIPSTTLTSAPIRAKNATAFPSFHYVPHQTQAAASTPSRKPWGKPNTDKAAEYTYDFSGLSGVNSGTEESAVKPSGAGHTEGTTESAGAGKTEGATESASAGKTEGETEGATEGASSGYPDGTTEHTGGGQTNGAKTYYYSPPVKENHPKPKPESHQISSSFSPEDFTLPKGATVEQLIAFLEKLLKALKEKVLHRRRKYARDFSME